MTATHPALALAYLVGALWTRLAREGLVLRSLLYPILLSGGTLALTLGGVIAFSPGRTVALTDEVYADLQADLSAMHFAVYPAPDPQAEVWARRAWGGSDGQTLWIRYGGPHATALEAELRERAGTAWRPPRGVKLPKQGENTAAGALIARIMGALFTLYGVVFGVGLVARDRQDGTLAAEWALAIPSLLPPLARWIAGSTALSAFFVYSTLLWHALFGVEAPLLTGRNGVAAALASVSVGLAATGQATMGAGFAAALTRGLAAGAALLGVGMAWPALGAYLPIASLTAEGGGWIALTLALASGPAAAHLVARWSVR